MISDEEFNYCDLLLIEWGKWVRSEYVGDSLAKFVSGMGSSLKDEEALLVDTAIARCDEPVRKMIKRVYLWRDISIDERILKQYIEEFSKEYHKDVA